MNTETITFRLKADITELDTLGSKIQEAGELWALPPAETFKLNLALDELVTNVVNHGIAEGEDPEAHYIELALSYADGVMTVEMRDTGRPFNPLEAMDPDTDLACEERDIGGLGIHLARKCLDLLTYERKGNINCLHMRKRLAGDGAACACPVGEKGEKPK